MPGVDGFDIMSTPHIDRFEIISTPSTHTRHRQLTLDGVDTQYRQIRENLDTIDIGDRSAPGSASTTPEYRRNRRSA